MLTGKHVAFIGGDARQLEVIKKCIQLDATVTLIGFDNLESSFTGATKKPLTCDVLKDVDALILPIVGTDDKGMIESIFSTKSIQLSKEHIEALPEKCVVYTGMAKPYLRELIKLHNVPLKELLNRDDVAIYNSIPTVEGALMVAIQNTDITIHGSEVIVLGLGRVGMSLARALHSLGAHVKVGAKRPEHIARSNEMGIDAFDLDDFKQYVSKVDIIFNTIPHLIITSDIIAQMPQTAFILDIASKPGGTDFRYAERRGIKAILAPSLPGIVAPKTAGQIIANTLARLLSEQAENQGGHHEQS
ncbi:dipicolinate synthase subunit DpsA [Brevibacillus laterosporus]|uniref:Dipicolinate synthase subunit A n=2 Tax=Brevibacillus TaxID=55080 RepID=A0A0F6XZZ0_BRELA|nr:MULTISPECIES: dipicolinate synthase subunit DpsA [Brevibacillus]AKF94611.1 dipicolinate synthase subunit A [Brevibacillus laterosporus]MCR8983631.1 dipicolinate synthase subunit DpsA [Brevibacillus laterosporus]MCZ0829349.1 dipicolinate synthase subunit DpsA [Brevibacillus halotolerans]GIO00682.1 dipicolinate synthase subunit A [Brevibacillus halotolerans]